MINDDDVDVALFDKLRNVFTHEKRRHYPNFQLGDNKGVITAFKKAALLCEEHQCDPEDFIKAQMNYCGNEMYASAVANKSAVANWRKFTIEQRGSPEQAFNVQVLYLTNALKNTTLTVDNVLLSNLFPFNEWFRCVITKEVNPSIMQKYGKKAKSQLTADKNLLTFLQRKNMDTSRVMNYAC